MELDCVPVTNLAPDTIVRAIGIFITCEIGDTDIILLVLNEYGNPLNEDVDLFQYLPPQNSCIRTNLREPATETLPPGRTRRKILVLIAHVHRFKIRFYCFLYFA